MREGQLHLRHRRPTRRPTSRPARGTRRGSGAAGDVQVPLPLGAESRRRRTAGRIIARRFRGTSRARMRRLSRCPTGCRCWRASATLFPALPTLPTTILPTDSERRAVHGLANTHTRMPAVPTRRQTALVCGGAAGMDGGGSPPATRCFRSGTSSSTRPTSRSQGRSDRARSVAISKRPCGAASFCGGC